VPQFAIIAVSILFDGLAYAMFLFITSVGLSVTMGLMGFVNLAHGAFAMAGGYVVVTLTRTLGVGFVPSLVIAAVVVGAVSVVFERGLYRRLYKSTDLEQVLLTIGLAFMAIATATYLYGPIPKSVPLPDWLQGDVNLGFRNFPSYRAFLIVLGVVQTLLALSTISPTLSEQFSALVNLAVVTNVIPYVVSLSALFIMMRTAKVAENVWRRNVFIVVIAMVYSVFALYASGKDAVMGGMLVLGVAYIIWGFLAPRFTASASAIAERGKKA